MKLYKAIAIAKVGDLFICKSSNKNWDGKTVLAKRTGDGDMCLVRTDKGVGSSERLVPLCGAVLDADWDLMKEGINNYCEVPQPEEEVYEQMVHEQVSNHLKAVTSTLDYMKTQGWSDIEVRHIIGELFTQFHMTYDPTRQRGGLW